jgi:hypothetical protein
LEGLGFGVRLYWQPSPLKPTSTANNPYSAKKTPALNFLKWFSCRTAHLHFFHRPWWECGLEFVELAPCWEWCFPLLVKQIEPLERGIAAYWFVYQ